MSELIRTLAPALAMAMNGILVLSVMHLMLTRADDYSPRAIAKAGIIAFVPCTIFTAIVIISAVKLLP